MRLGDKHIDHFDLNSLRIIGCAGEPLNEAAYEWMYNKIGKGRCPLIDNYWQTESGSNLLAPIPAAFGKGGMVHKPGSVGVPFYGIDLRIVDPITLKEINSDGDCTGMLVIKESWPSIARYDVKYSHYLYKHLE
jgi:acetyl-CoA synthetase